MKKISVCIISKNEEKRIANCIKAITNSLDTTKYVYEISLTDTGSTDNTIEIARSLGANIHNYVWQNDFAKARNFAITKAQYNYILFVDSDEFLESFNWQITLELLDKYPKCVGMISRRNLCNSGNSTAITIDKVARLFDRRLYHYELSIHEQLVPNDSSQLTVFDIPLTFYHEGYIGTEKELAEKAKRNNDLLFKELANHPNDSYILFQIAQSYGLVNDTDKQYYYAQKAYESSPNIHDVYTTDLILLLGYSYINHQEYEKAITLYNTHYNELHHLADYLCFGAYAHIKNQSLITAIDICLAALDSDDFSMEGSNSYIPNYYLGCIYEAYENFSMAKKYYTLANHYLDTDKKMSSIDDYYNNNITKKVSFIFTDNCLCNIDHLIRNIENQTMDINSLELLFVGNLSTANNELSFWESKYPNSIMLINIEESLSIDELANIALNYSSGEYINIPIANTFEYIDGIRHIYMASNNETCDIGACNIVWESENDFYIDINSVTEADAIKNANILPQSISYKIYSRDFIIKNNLDYSKLLVSDDILYAKKIYCSQKALL